QKPYQWATCFGVENAPEGWEPPVVRRMIAEKEATALEISHTPVKLSETHRKNYHCEPFDVEARICVWNGRADDLRAALEPPFFSIVRNQIVGHWKYREATPFCFMTTIHVD